MRVLSTLLYHSIFDYPLTIDEIHRYLISEKAVSLKSIKEVINNLLKTEEVYFHNGFFQPLAPRLQAPEALATGGQVSLQPLALIKLHQRRKSISQKKLIIAKQASRIISIIPWIKMAAVTGALAMKNADENDDIDLMIIASKNRLWIVRPFVLLIVSLFFKRRKPSSFSNHSGHLNHLNHSSARNHICLNLWLDKQALIIPADQRNLYTAHELAQMKPIFNKDNTYERMMWENRWGRRYLANAWGRLKGWQVNRLKKPRFSAFQPFSLFNPFNLLNLLAFRLQLWYMRPKMTTERVSLHAAFFHPGNRAADIFTRFEALMRSI